MSSSRIENKMAQNSRLASSTIRLRLLPMVVLIYYSWIASLCQQLGMQVHAFVVIVPSKTSFHSSKRRLCVSLSSSSSSTSSNNNNDSKHRRRRKRDVFLQDIMGFPPRKSSNTTTTSTTVLFTPKKSIPVPKNNITTLFELDQHWNDTRHWFRRRNSQNRIDYTALLRAAHVQGNTQIIGNPLYPNYTHPVAQILHDRKRQLVELQPQLTTKPIFPDGCKVGLAVEGGGTWTNIHSERRESVSKNPIYIYTIQYLTRPTYYWLVGWLFRHARVCECRYGVCHSSFEFDRYH